VNKCRFCVLAGVILVAVASRLIPHAPNFAPIAALALFGGASFADRRLAFVVPLVALFLSDLVLGFAASTPIVYASFAGIVCLGIWLRQRQTGWRLTGAVLAGALLFFIATNFGVWAFDGLYSMTWPGLLACYVAAIPFFANTVLSDVLYSVLLFGSMAIVEKSWPMVAESSPATSS